ncbi:MAG TPA: hypothetical protein VM287_09895, partial [Egibacteraceae bacterium]|nr:hypothetical protein [Egibacteraceae bacterium]
HTLALEFGPDGWDWAGRLLTLAGLLAAAALLWTRGRPPAPPSPAEAGSEPPSVPEPAGGRTSP